MSKEEINTVIEKAASGKMDEMELNNLIESVIKKGNLTKEQKSELKQIANAIKEGGLQVEGLNSEIIDQVLLMQKALKASGMDQKEIAKIIAKATGAGMDEKEIASVISKAMKNSNLSKQEKEQLKVIEKNLKDGKLRTKGVKSDAVDQLMLLKEVLQSSGADDKEIAKLLAKATSEGLDEQEIQNIISKAQQSDSLSSDSKKKLDALQKSLETGALKTPGMSEEKSQAFS